MMKYPNLNTKHANESMIEPKRYLEYLKDQGHYPSFAPPQGVILSYQKSLLDHAINNHAVTQCDGFLKRMYYLNETGNFASSELTTALQTSLDNFKLPYNTGTSWTIDAPYRETFQEAKQYQDEGVMTVEMEASALFAVSQFRGLNIASMFAISDSLADIEWHPQFHSSKTQMSLENILKASTAALMDFIL